MDRSSPHPDAYVRVNIHAGARAHTHIHTHTHTHTHLQELLRRIHAANEREKDATQKLTMVAARGCVCWRVAYVSLLADTFLHVCVCVCACVFVNAGARAYTLISLATRIFARTQCI